MPDIRLHHGTPSVPVASPPPRGPLASPTPAAAPPARARVAYVMNAFPRLSETFIAHEIHQLERLGMALRLYAVKHEPEPFQHPVVACISAPLSHLPAASSLSGSTLVAWLGHNLPAFWPAHARLLRQRPLAWLATAASTLALAWRHRPRGAHGQAGGKGAPVWALRKVFIKEFLQAGHIADAVLRAGDVGHLHGHFCHGVATITWMASRLAGMPFSFTAHAKDIYQPTLNPGKLLERKLGAARFVATCTCANAEVLRARHARPHEVHTIYHGLDTDWFAPASAPAAAPSGAFAAPPTPTPPALAADATAARLAAAAVPPGDAPLLLAVGRLVAKKGFDQLVLACARLKARGLAFRCLIVGEPGDASQAVLALISAHGLQDCVHLHRAMPQDTLRALYRLASVFVLPCQVMDDGDRDGFPNVLAEAMAMGVPVVSTAISGIPEMVDDGEHGLLVPPRDTAALADALARLLADAGLRRRLADAARARICARFDSRRTTLALRDLFEAQLARAHHAAAQAKVVA